MIIYYGFALFVKDDGMLSSKSFFNHSNKSFRACFDHYNEVKTNFENDPEFVRWIVSGIEPVENEIQTPSEVV